MVKNTILLLLIASLLSCSSGTTAKPSPDMEMDTYEFELDHFKEQVKAFLDSRKEVPANGTYDAFFVNTTNCAACTEGEFEDLAPFLRSTLRQTFVFINDSTLLRLQPPNRHVQFICLPKAQFDDYHIFHGKIYLYTVTPKQIRSLQVGGNARDSLNRL